MASTAYQNNIRVTNLAGFNFGFDARTEWDSISRTNNTITINNLRTRMRVNSGSEGSSFYGYNIDVHTDVPSGTRRRNSDLGSGTFTRGSDYLGSGGNYSITVGATDTSISSRSGVTVNGATGWTNSQTITIPSAGLPTGSSINASNVKTTTATLNASVSSWGINCTAGTGQRIEYREQGGSWINLAYSTSTSHSRNLTGLEPGTVYEARTYTVNGAGRTASSSTITFKTLPVSGLLPLLMAIAG